MSNKELGATKVESDLGGQPQYDKIRVLGKGSFGTAAVYRRRADFSLVVIKEIDLKQFKGDQEKLSALDEAKIMSTLDHINVIKYHNAYSTEWKLLIEMEYASMGTLANYLSLQTEPLGEREILIIIKQIVSGLSYLHDRHIIHSDLKTANIFITIDGLVKIGDFGIAHYMRGDPSKLHLRSGLDGAPGEAPHSAARTNKSRLSQPPQAGDSQFAGTLVYSSPEKCLGQAVGLESDIWSLGCILYELITCRPLFSGDSLPEIVMKITLVKYESIRRDISPQLKSTFELMISRWPVERPSARDTYGTIVGLLEAQFNWPPNMQHQPANRSRKRPNRGLDLSTDAGAYLGNETQFAADKSQLKYPHSLIYLVQLESHHMRIDRVDLPATKRMREICRGDSHYLALTYDNIVYGWGSKAHGQLGACRSDDPSSVGRSVDLESRSTGAGSSGDHQAGAGNSKAFIINELNHRKIIQVAAGCNFSVFLSKTGIVMTCGYGRKGCLGRGNLRSSPIPCMVESLLNTDVVFISSGPEHVVTICGDGKAFAWGNSGEGRLGIGTRCLPRSSSDRSQSFADSPGAAAAAAGHRYVSIPQQVVFDERVFAVSAYCGDKCTILIDSKNRCWACGENRCNRLGLDVKRSFKKTTLVERTWIPTEIAALSGHQVISCSISRDHSIFMTNSGMLLVYGQDIDCTFKLRSQLMQDLRRFSADLLEGSCADSSRLGGGRSEASALANLAQLAKSAVVNRQSLKYKRSGRKSAPNDSEKYPRLKLRGLQRAHVDSFLKRSRAFKRMTFEGVLAYGCTGKFSIALTSDNRVYFWGTRSYACNEEEFARRTTAPHPGRTKHRDGVGRPHLVPPGSDECFIRVGATNSSLMDTIQELGSDQPIVHARDPRLTANSMADLWILDYRPLAPSLTSSSSSSTSSGSDCGSNVASNCCCDSPCDSDSSWDSGESRGSAWKHDVILDPQPIVSLYVPSMFNNSGCSLQLVDLYCFDAEQFYLVLDTTVELQQVAAPNHHQVHQVQSAQPGLHRNTLAVVASGATSRSLERPDGNESSSVATKQRSTGDESGAHGVARNFAQLVGPEAMCRSAADDPAANKAAMYVAATHCPSRRRHTCHRLDHPGTWAGSTNSTDESGQTYVAVGRNFSNPHMELMLAAGPEEPQSISTFAANSVGDQIIFGNSMRLATADHDLEPLRFGGSQDDQSEESYPAEDFSSAGTLMAGRCERSCGSNDVADAEPENSPSSWCRHRQIRDTSASAASLTCEGTSPMPSWVRNEFCMQRASNDENSRAQSLDNLARCSRPVGNFQTWCPLNSDPETSELIVDDVGRSNSEPASDNSSDQMLGSQPVEELSYLQTIPGPFSRSLPIIRGVGSRGGGRSHDRLSCGLPAGHWSANLHRDPPPTRSLSVGRLHSPDCRVFLAKGISSHAPSQVGEADTRSVGMSSSVNGKTTLPLVETGAAREHTHAYAGRLSTDDVRTQHSVDLGLREIASSLERARLELAQPAKSTKINNIRAAMLSQSVQNMAGDLGRAMHHDGLSRGSVNSVVSSMRRSFSRLFC